MTLFVRVMIYHKHAPCWKGTRSLHHLRVPPISTSCDALKKARAEPLRILFCGSDSFSIVSLQKLHDHHQKHKDLIASIDVVCRPGKPIGRGLKHIRKCEVSCNLIFRYPLKRISAYLRSSGTIVSAFA